MDTESHENGDTACLLFTEYTSRVCLNTSRSIVHPSVVTHSTTVSSPGSSVCPLSENTALATPVAVTNVYGVVVFVEIDRKIEVAVLLMMRVDILAGPSPSTDARGTGLNLWM